MYDSTFTPKGPTVLVGTSVVQATGTNPNEQCTSCLVRCLVTGYLSWMTSELGTTTAPAITVAAPTAGVPSANTIGMTAGAVQTLGLPVNAWFKASAAAAFEITPGEGV